MARTFANYASCLSEVLGGAAAGGVEPRTAMLGEAHFAEALADNRGLIFATAHTAGWEAVGPSLTKRRGLRVLIAEAPERDQAARAIQDDARRSQGLLVAHVGDGPFSGLPLLRHLRDGGVVAIQVDRAPAHLRARQVTMFNERALIPEGPLRLAALTGAPILPVFTARLGYRSYQVVASKAVRISRAADDSELNAAAQEIADALAAFVRTHPTQWFHFGENG